MGGAHEREGDLALRPDRAGGSRGHALHGVSGRGARGTPRGGTRQGRRPPSKTAARAEGSEAMNRNRFRLWIVVGIAIGTAIGVATHKIASGVSLGAALGTLLAFALSRASKQG